MKDGREPATGAGVPAALRDTMRSVPVSFDVAASRLGARDRGPARAADHRRCRSRVGGVVADERDLAKIAVIERHHATGRVGLGFVRGFGLHAGAFASTVAHDAHNLVVVGVDDGDMALCAARAQELGGGLVVARDGVGASASSRCRSRGCCPRRRSRRSRSGWKASRTRCAAWAWRSTRRS